MNVTRLLRTLPARLIVGMVLIAFACLAWIYLGDNRPRKYSLTISAGSASGIRQQIAQRLAAESRCYGITIETIPTLGSQDALDKVNSGELDLALVQGGLSMAERTNVRQVAHLYLESLHLLVRESLAESVTESLDSLQGKRINISQPGSGTSTLSLEVLDFVGLRPSDYHRMELSYSDLMKLSDDELPDATFMVATLPSDVAQWLISEHGYRLVPLGFAKAMSRHGMLGLKGRQSQLLFEHLYEAEIPAFTYGVAPAVPTATIPTIGTRLLVVAHQGADSAAIERLIEVLYESAFAKVSEPPLSTSLLEVPPELAWHEGTRCYISNNRPLIQADLLDLTDKLTAITAGVLGGAAFLTTWLMERVRKRRLRGFDAYLDRVAEVERESLELESAPQLDVPKLRILRARLSQLKGEAIDEFAEGNLMGAELITGFLIHVNDVRQHLATLMLHARDHSPDREASSPK
jgi:TRAP transporter TAXI family solute receptor